MNIEQAKAYVQRVEQNPDLLKSPTTLQIYLEAIKIMQQSTLPNTVDRTSHDPQFCEKCRNFAKLQMDYDMELSGYRNGQIDITNEMHKASITGHDLINLIEKLSENNNQQKRVIGLMKTGCNNRTMHLNSV